MDFWNSEEFEVEKGNVGYTYYYRDIKVIQRQFLIKHLQPTIGCTL